MRYTEDQMIEHYSLHEINKLTDRFGLTDGVPKGVKPRYNISPVQPAPVISKNDGKTELRMMNWGLVPQGAKDANSVFRYKTFNTKSENVFSKPVWETAVRQQRCIIPVNGFYMVRSGGDNKDAYYFTSGDESLLGLAGMYTTWTDPNGEQQQTYTLLTIEANKVMPLPFGRIPVILHGDDEARWLDTTIQDFSSLVSVMRPYEGATLAYRRASDDVNSAKIDAPHLIEPLKQ